MPRDVRIQGFIEKLDGGGRLKVDEVAELLAIDPAEDGVSFEGVVATAARVKRRCFSSQVFPISPLYVTSICSDRCAYCNYRAGNRGVDLERVRLIDSELSREIQYLLESGIRIIELVYATDPFLTAQDIARHVSLAALELSRVGGGYVGINAAPFTTAEYEIIRRAGLDFAVLWQETYNREVYANVHAGSPQKEDYDFRYTAHERMIEAGIRCVGIGVLSGLAPWREDWLALLDRAKLLSERYAGRLDKLILGIPRLKPAAGAVIKESVHTPTDREFRLAVAVFDLVFPDALPFVSTREPWEMCVALAEGGGVLFTLDCKTIPGGYSLGRKGYQFPTFDFSGRTWMSRLSNHGLTASNANPFGLWPPAVAAAEVTNAPPNSP